MTPNTWKAKAQKKISDISLWLERFRQAELPYYVYGTIAGLTIWPLVEAAVQTGQLAPALNALYGTAAGVGANLLANQIEHWKNQRDAPTIEEVATWLVQESEENHDLRELIDTIIEKLDAIPQAQALLSELEDDRFIVTLQEELRTLGNIDRFASILVSGDESIAYAGRVSVEGDVHAPINTGSLSIAGDFERTIQANIYIEQQTVLPKPKLSAGTLREAYLNRLFQQTIALDLSGVDPKTVAASGKHGIKLTDVYTALTTIGEQFGSNITSSSPISAISELDKHQYLVVLGEPGSGKSTLIRFVTACLAGETLKYSRVNLSLLTTPLLTEGNGEPGTRQSWHHGTLLPVCIILRQLAASFSSNQPTTVEHLWKFIKNDLKAAGLQDFLTTLRKEWQVQGGILLLDGLDEVPETNGRRQQILRVITSFTQSYPKVRVLVTSRTYAYQDSSWHLPNFTTTLLGAFSESQISHFIDSWYRSVADLHGLPIADMQGRAELLKRAVLSSYHLTELAKRPLLLTLIASLYTWRGGSLPQNREELYAHTVDLLLDWWEAPKVIRNELGELINPQPSLSEWLQIDREKVRRLLNKLAFEAHATQTHLYGTADITQQKLASVLIDISQNPDVRPARLIEYLTLRAGLLLSHGAGVYAFPHRTIQEYLAACHLTDDEFPDKLAELTRADPGRWREVALLAGAKAARGSSSTVWSLAEALCYEGYEEAHEQLGAVWGALITGQLLAESAQLENISVRNQPKLENTRRWLVNLLREPLLPAIERTKAASSLAILGDPRPEATDVDAMQFCFIPAGTFFMGSDLNEGKEDVEARKVLKAQSAQHYVDIPYNYWLAQYPVTNAQFAHFVKDGGYQNPSFWEEAHEAKIWNKGKVTGQIWAPELINWKELELNKPVETTFPFNLPNHPVVGITWYEALAFTKWLTFRWRTKGTLSNEYQVCLPSEAEWEKAARGGIEIPEQPVISMFDSKLETKTPNLTHNKLPKRRYPWGNVLTTENANWKESNVGATNGVQCFTSASSAYGCQELVGNSLEWTRSLWGTNIDVPEFTYPYLLDDAREVLNAGSEFARTMRGGHWHADEIWLRCSSRGANYPNYRFIQIVGFRICIIPTKILATS